MIKKILKRTSPWLVGVIIISLLSHWRWFTFQTFTHGDTWYEFSDIAFAILKNFTSIVWNPLSGFGGVPAEPYFFPTYVLRGMFAMLNFPFEGYTFLIRYLPIIILSAIGSYIFCNEFLKNNKFAFVGSIFYISTTYFLTLQGEHLVLAMAYATAPITIFVTYRYTSKWIYQSRTFFNIHIFILLNALQIILEPRVYYILLPILSAFPFLTGAWKSKRFWMVTIYSGAIILLINLFWLIIIATSGINQIAEIVDRPLFGSQYKTLSHAITSFRSSWTTGEPVPFSLQPIFYRFWLIPIMAFIGLCFNNRKTKDRSIFMFWIIIALIGILLTKQDTPPFTYSYVFLYKYFPGFNLFRESSKFYILISLSYSILIPLSLLKILSVLERGSKTKKAFGLGIYCSVVLLLLINFSGLITGKFGALFSAKNIPAEYQLFAKYIQLEKGFSRNLFVPADSRWAYFSFSHPKINVSNIIQGQWKIFVSETDTLPNERILSLFKKSFSNHILDTANIKNVIIPLEDKANNDNFFPYYGGKENPEIRDWYIAELDKLNYLKKLDIGTKDLIIYENSNYKPYLYSFKKLMTIESLESIEPKYEFGEKIMDEMFFTKNSGANIFSNNTYGLFENIYTDNISENQIYANLNNEATAFYENVGKKTLFYTLTNSALEIFAGRLGNLRQEGMPIALGTDIRQNIFNGSVPNINETYIKLGSRLVPLEATQVPKRFGNAMSSDLVRETGPNAILNPSFESGFWSEEVGDCNAYDTNPILAMNIEGNEEGQGRYLELSATRHIACTTQNQIPVTGSGDYMFSFDYQSANGKQVGYYMSFNDPLRTVIAERIPVVDQEWQKFRKYLQIPESATQVSLVIYSYSLDNKSEVVTRYDNFVLRPLETIETISYDYEPTFEKLPIEISDNYSFIYSDNVTDFSNQIINPSLEDGLWQQDVGDCNAYDRHPLLEMNLVEGQKEGEKALELGATRHIACTGPGVISVNGGSTYLLSFDYQSPNGKQAGYYIGFSGTEGNSVSERIPITDTDWHTYTKQITVPEDAISASLVLYSYSEDGIQNIMTRYDNFHLIELPDFANRYYLVNDLQKNFQNPEQISFDLVSPTKKLVHVKGATTPFYLAMSESYHDQWQLQFSNKKSYGILQSWMPFVWPDRIPDEQHFELNGFLNGWYVDTEQYCEKNDLCRKNSNGSYDMELVVEFFPQRWFYLGLLISGSTLTACIGYLIYNWKKKRVVHFPAKHVSA